jgi:hypothetical protein
MSKGDRKMYNKNSEIASTETMIPKEVIILCSKPSQEIISMEINVQE